MARLAEALRAALGAIRAHLLRAALTVLGMVIGVAAVIAVVALLQGFGQSITQQFRNLGANGLVIAAYLPQKAALEGKTARITPDDLLAIRQRVAGIRDVVPLLPLAQFSASVRYGNRSSNTSVNGTTSGFPRNGARYPVQGRFVVAGDDTTRRPVAVIGQTLIKDLHLPADPEGHFIQLFGTWFKVVGVLNKVGTLVGLIDRDNLIYIPYTTALSLSGAVTAPNIVIQLDVDNTRAIKPVEARITAVLRRQHHLLPGEEDDFKIQSAAELTKALTSALNSASLILGAIVGISLLVGGVGIMNVMLVSVTERTREIGIHKSLGATRADILLQFLLEAVLLSLLGGLVGLALGYGIGKLVVHLIPAFAGAIVPGWTIALSLGFTAVVGLVFGITPAAKAAALDPIEALRYE